MRSKERIERMAREVLKDRIRKIGNIFDGAHLYIEYTEAETGKAFRMHLEVGRGKGAHKQKAQK